ncbi:MAG: cation:proton antiporter [Verrucomicrobiota bacterium]
MSHEMVRLIVQLGVITISARLFGLLFSRYLRLPRVLGELSAGMLIGPYALGGLATPFFHTPLFPMLDGQIPVSASLYGIATLAILILLFRAGLETDLSIFLKYSIVSSAAGVSGVLFSFFAGALITVACGIADSIMDPEALFLGTVSTATSVGITARILSEKNKMSSPEGVTILGGAVLDDVLGIIILTIVVSISMGSAAGNGVNWGKVGIVAAKAMGFWLACTVIGILLAPRITRIMKWFKSDEVMAASAFGLALLLAGLSEMAGLAMIIGAYVTGLSLSQTDVAYEIHDRTDGIYDFFVPVFFCVMGMMVDFSVMLPILGFGLIYASVAMLAKVIGCGLPAWLLGFNLRGAVRIGMGMLPRGEVTLIVAGIGLSMGVVSTELFGVAVLTLLVASVIAPGALVKSFEGGSGIRAKLAGKTEDEDTRLVELEVPSGEVSHFLRSRIEQAFRNEEFYVKRLQMERPICHIRKEDIVITLTEQENKIVLETRRKNEQLVRLIVLEELLELKDFLDSVQKMKSPEALGADFMSQLFTGETEE